MVHNDQYYQNLEKKLGGSGVNSSKAKELLTQRERQALQDRQERKALNNSEYQDRMRGKYGW